MRRQKFLQCGLWLLEQKKRDEYGTCNDAPTCESGEALKAWIDPCEHTDAVDKEAIKEKIKEEILQIPDFQGSTVSISMIKSLPKPRGCAGTDDRPCGVGPWTCPGCIDAFAAAPDASDGRRPSWTSSEAHTLDSENGYQPNHNYLEDGKGYKKCMESVEGPTTVEPFNEKTHNCQVMGGNLPVIFDWSNVNNIPPLARVGTIPTYGVNIMIQRPGRNGDFSVDNCILTAMALLKLTKGTNPVVAGWMQMATKGNWALHPGKILSGTMPPIEDKECHDYKCNADYIAQNPQHMAKIENAIRKAIASFRFTAATAAMRL